jgi:cytochrome c biogenesis protein CcmG, thiol:disulfide interchange protein DsbE
MSEASTVLPRRGLNPWLVLPLVLFLALAALFYARIGRDPGILPSALIGKTAPALALPALPGLIANGQPIDGLTDADLRRPGGVLLNIFASWCVPCREEHPVLMELSKDSGVVVLGLDYKDTPENARRFLGTFGNPYRKVGADISGHTGLDFGVYGVPETFAIDATGRIVAKHVGALTMADARALLRKAAEAN